MDKTLTVCVTLTTIVLVLIFIMMIASTKKTNKIEEEMINYVPKDLNVETDMYSPRVYELVYLKRDPNDNTIWLFSKVKSQLKHDMKAKGINYLLIQGVFYKAEYLGESDTFFRVRLQDKCMTDDEKYFKSCGSTTLGISSLIHALGYTFDAN